MRSFAAAPAIEYELTIPSPQERAHVPQSQRARERCRPGERSCHGQSSSGGRSWRQRVTRGEMAVSQWVMFTLPAAGEVASAAYPRFWRNRRTWESRVS